MTLEEQFGKEEAEFLRTAIAGLDLDGYDCVDNERLCLEGDPAGEAAYEEAARQGCCGSLDVRLGPSPAGRSASTTGTEAVGRPPQPLREDMTIDPIQHALTDPARPAFSWRSAIVRLSAVALPLLALAAAARAL